MSTFALFLDLTIETVRDLRRRERPAGSGEDPRYLETGLRDARRRAVASEQGEQTSITYNGERFRFPQLAEYATSREGTNQPGCDQTDGEVMLGIYEFDANGYKVCFAPAGKPRPSDFSSKPGSGYTLQFWQRPKK